MKEKEFQALAQQKLDGTLSADQEAAFASLIAQNDSRRKQWQRLQNVHTRLQNPPLEEAPALFAANVMAALQARQMQAKLLPSWFNRILPVVVLGVSTAAALPLMIGILLITVVSQQPMLMNAANVLLGDSLIVAQNIIGSLLTMGVAFLGWLLPQPSFLMMLGVTPVLAFVWLRTMRHYSPQLSA